MVGSIFDMTAMPCTTARTTVPASSTGSAATPLSPNLHLPLRLQLVGALGHDLLAFIDSSHDRGQALAHRHLHRPHLRGLVGRNDIDIRPLAAVLPGSRRHGEGAPPDADLQSGVVELVR